MPRAKSWHLSLIQTSVLADKSSPKLDLSLSALGIQLLMHDLSGALGLAVILYISKEELVAYFMRQNILYSNAYVLPSLVYMGSKGPEAENIIKYQQLRR